MKPYLSLWPGRPPLYAQAPKVGSKIEMERIATLVAGRHGLTLEQIRSSRRFRQWARPRQEAMATIYATGRFSYPTIGAFFGRDHSTVRYAKLAAETRALAEQEAA